MVNDIVLAVSFAISPFHIFEIVLSLLSIFHAVIFLIVCLSFGQPV